MSLHVLQFAPASWAFRWQGAACTTLASTDVFPMLRIRSANSCLYGWVSLIHPTNPSLWKVFFHSPPLCNHHLQRNHGWKRQIGNVNGSSFTKGSLNSLRPHIGHGSCSCGWVGARAFRIKEVWLFRNPAPWILTSFLIREGSYQFKYLMSSFHNDFFHEISD